MLLCADSQISSIPRLQKLCIIGTLYPRERQRTMSILVVKPQACCVDTSRGVLEARSVAWLTLGCTNSQQSCCSNVHSLLTLHVPTSTRNKSDLHVITSSPGRDFQISAGLAHCARKVGRQFSGRCYIDTSEKLPAVRVSLPQQHHLRGSSTLTTSQFTQYGRSDPLLPEFGGVMALGGHWMGEADRGKMEEGGEKRSTVKGRCVDRTWQTMMRPPMEFAICTT
jgi:hypothetical protein